MIGEVGPDPGGELRADAGGQGVAEDDGHEVEQTGSRLSSSGVDGTGDEARALPELAEQCGTHGFGLVMPVPGVLRTAELAGQCRQFLQLEDEEGGQVGGLYHAVPVESGGVVPAAVVAMLVVRELMAGGTPMVEPEAGPGGQPRVGVVKLSPVEVEVFA